MKIKFQQLYRFLNHSVSRKTCSVKLSSNEFFWAEDCMLLIILWSVLLEINANGVEAIMK